MQGKRNGKGRGFVIAGLGLVMLCCGAAPVPAQGPEEREARPSAEKIADALLPQILDRVTNQLDKKFSEWETLLKVKNQKGDEEALIRRCDELRQEKEDLNSECGKLRKAIRAVTTTAIQEAITTIQEATTKAVREAPREATKQVESKTGTPEPERKILPSVIIGGIVIVALIVISGIFWWGIKKEKDYRRRVGISYAVARLKDDSQAAEKDAADSKRKREDAEMIKKRRDGEYGTLSEKNRRLKETITGLEAEKAALGRRVQELEAEKAALEKRVQELEAKGGNA